PETHLAQDKGTGTYYILSEEVRGYKHLPTSQAKNFANGSLTGLGQVMLGSMFVQEVDLKNGNVGINDKGQVIKIDGDWCFASEQNYIKEYKLTPEGIASLPYPKDFSAFNWLDLIKQDEYYRSSIVNPELSHSPQFRAEVNEAMLKICLLPDNFITRFVSAHIPEGGEQIINLIKNRREELKSSAYQNPSFQNYLKSNQAQLQAELMVGHLITFKANGETLIVPLEHQAQLAHTIRNNLNTMKTELASVIANTLSPEKELVRANQELITQIQSHRVNDKDFVLLRYVEQAQTQLIANSNNTQNLSTIKKELIEVLASVSAQSVTVIKDNIKTLRKHGSESKANRIEEALCTIPLQERRLVLAQADNKVKEAMLAPNIPEKMPPIVNNVQPTLVKMTQLGTSNPKPEPEPEPEPEPTVASMQKIQPLAGQLVKDNQNLLTQIVANRISDKDVLLMSYVKHKKSEIAQSSENPERLMTINEELNDILVSVSSKTVHSVKDTIKTSRKYDAIERADLIELAMCNTPLEEREYVLEEENNEVQKAIAINIFATTKKTAPANAMINDKAIESFKDIKAKFVQMAKPKLPIVENENDLSSNHKM
ncbi:MAG: hypothetical protein PSV35_05775, partial [bacterium]|nr:hypothetical protein [bacterium]